MKARPRPAWPASPHPTGVPLDPAAMDSARPTRLAGGWRPWLASLVITGGIFWYLLAQIDPAEILATARGMTPRYLWAFLALLLAGVITRAVRFWVLLGQNTRFSLLTGIVLARNLFVDLLPARLGEFSYVYLLTTRAGRPVEDGLASLMLAVAFDVVALAPLLVLAVLVVGGGGAVAGPWLALAAVALGLVAYFVARMAAPIGMRIAEWLAPAPTGATGRRVQLAALIRRTAEALGSVWTRGIFTPVLLLSMIVRVCKFGSYYFLVLAIMGGLGLSASSLGFFRVFLGVVSAELAAALPIHGIAGFGTFEAAWAFSFTQLGFARSDAIVSGILAHAVSQVVEYSLGACALLYLMLPGMRHDAARP